MPPEIVYAEDTAVPSPISGKVPDPLIVRAPVEITKLRELESVLFGSEMAICAVPAVEKRLEGIVAASCADWIRLGCICTVAPPGVVQITWAAELKYCPATVIEVPALPGGALFGETALIVSGEIVNDRVEDAPPVAFITAI